VRPWGTIGVAFAALACGATPAKEKRIASTPAAPSSAAPKVEPRERPPGPRGDIVEIDAARGYVCARFENTSVQCARLDRSPTVPWKPRAEAVWIGAPEVVGISGRCGWLADGTLRCADAAPECGSVLAHFRDAHEAAAHGEVPCPTATNGSLPCVTTLACARPDRFRGVTRAATGRQLGSGQVCATLSNGTVACADPFATELVPIAAATGARALSASRWESCALMPGGSVQCWLNGNRWNMDSDLRAASPLAYAPAPHALPLTNVVAIDVGDEHSCAVLEDRTLRCWGGNEDGQLGDGTTTESVEPVRVRGLTDVVRIHAGFLRTCAQLGDGSWRCWGENASGAIDRAGRNRLTPVRVPALADAVQVALGLETTCALLQSKEVVCWGCAPPARCGLGYTQEAAMRDLRIAREGCSAPVPIAWLP
jgi:hypothetical protein